MIVVSSEFEIINDERINELLNANVEHEHLDYKLDLDINSTSEIVRIAKDMAAMANSGGGNIVIGVDDDFNKKGLELSFKVDEADLRNKINRYFSPKIDFLYREVIRTVLGTKRKFAVINVLPAKEVIMPIRDGNYHKNGRQKFEFRCGDILIRDGSESKRAGPYEIRRLIDELAFDKKIETRKRYVESVNKIIEANSKPEKKKEILPSNLLPVRSIPDIVWSASTTFVYKEAAYSYLNQKGYVEDVPNFILRDQKVFTFSNLENPENPLRLIINACLFERLLLQEGPLLRQRS